MQEIFLHVGNVVLPVLLCALVGYGYARLALPFDKKTIGALVSNVGYPTLILSHLTRQHVELAEFLEMMAAAVAVVAMLGVIGYGVLKLMRLPVRGYLSPMMLCNVGNVGLPVSALAFGHQGLAYAMAFVVVVLVGVFTLGVWLPAGKVSGSDILKKPVIYAVVVSLVMLGTHTRLPGLLEQPLDILAGLAIPLMLMMLGHTLATLETGALRRGAALALIHIAMAAGIAFVLVHAFGFSGTARGVFILQCLMPVSVATYLWVEANDPADAPAVAGFILISTLLTVAVLPVVLAFWI